MHEVYTYQAPRQLHSTSPAIHVTAIIATKGRTAELERLLSSLARQDYPSLTAVIVDQNGDDRLEEAVGAVAKHLDVVRVRSPTGLSRARNLGLSHARDGIVCFPDDDSEYPRHLLERVVDYFSAKTDCIGLSGRTIDRFGNPSAGRFDPHPGPVLKSNVFTRINSTTLFVRWNDQTRSLRFDETLGLGSGTPWQSGEDTDFPLQLLRYGHRICYEPGIQVYHPQHSQMTRDAETRAYNYGCGLGRVMKKHHFPARAMVMVLVRPFGASLLFLLLGRIRRARFYWYSFIGRLRGLASRGGLVAQAGDGRPPQ